MRRHDRLLPAPRSEAVRPLRRRQLHPYPQNIPRARRRVAQLAVDWGHPGTADDAALLASELCTNALLHGCLRDGLFRVETSLTGNALRIAVTDPKGERLPETRPPATDDQFGRGLLIVRALADRWAVEKLTVGKTVWAELDILRCPNAKPAAPPAGFK
ncbi:ATP-binding protein [Streptomyces sp. NPDC005202]|uniref:ATP-binding protein n=1 Tax=Streptomyces sp. NPDC005202 TaxID=3157021 RepID=UPI0033A36165